LCQREMEGICVAHSGGLHAVGKFEKQMRGADEGSAASDIGKMLDQHASLAGEMLYEDQAEARRALKRGFKRDKRNFEHRHGRDCRDRIVAIAIGGSKSEKIAPHGEVDNLPLAAFQIAIDA